MPTLYTDCAERNHITASDWCLELVFWTAQGPGTAEAQRIDALNKTEYYVTDYVLSRYNNGAFVRRDVLPKPGDKLFVAPGCPLAIDDIRKNYVIKRDPDAGDFNVFSKINLAEIHKCDLYIHRNKYYVTLTRSDSLKFEASHSAFFRKAARIYPISKRYKSIIELINGDLNKPCITPMDLDISGKIPLTSDALRLAYIAGDKAPSPEAKSAFLMQLESLNQTNWREHIGAIVQFRNLFRGKTQGYQVLTSSLSTLPKSIQEMVRRMSEWSTRAQDEKDAEMIKDLIYSIVGINEDQVFMSFDSFYDKIFLPLSTNNRNLAFDVIVMVRKKK